MNNKLVRYLSITMMLLAFTAMVFAKGGGDKKSTLRKTLGEPVYTKININNISTWIKNDGETDINQNGNSGLVFPKGSNKTAIFQSGFLWGGKVDGQFRVGGSAYRQGTVPGYIKADGTPVSPDAPDVRIYRVRRDYKDADLTAEVADGDGADQAAVRAQYETDWNEWPASHGAPFKDVNGNGTYEPSIDIPGVPGADQTVWFVANDFDPAQTDFMYGSLPMGIEEQVTVWGYKSSGALGNMIFRKFLIINKNQSQKEFTDMYACMWSDPDLGDAGDDYVGCDTTLSLGFVYNANAQDATYNPLPPPAAGFDFFQGPLVPGDAGDVGISKGQYVPGKKNLPMTAFFFFINGDAVYTDPVQGVYDTGTLEWLNLFEGKVSTTGQPFTDPNTNEATKFTLAGDPVTGLGWIDGQLHPPGDRRLGMVSGTFNMAYGDTQEIVVAEICAGAVPGVDRLGAISLLKFYDKQAQLAYDNFFNVPTAPPAPVVTASPFDGEVILSWGNDAAKVSATEDYSNGGFSFEGYNVYQLPSATATIDQARRVATYDVVNGVLKIEDLAFDATSGVVGSKVVAFGSDSGIKRSISITTDAFKSGLPLLNGSRYFFAVTSYGYNPDPNAVPRVLENAISIMTVVPHKPDPGVRYEGSAGQVVATTHSSGQSDGSVTPIVIDPSQLTGNNYQVAFTEDSHGQTVWNLKNTTSGKTLLSDQTNISGDDNYLLTEGLQVKVQGPEYYGVSYSYTGSRWLSGNSANGGDLMFGSAFLGYNFWGATSVAPADLRSVHVEVSKILSYTDSDGNGKYTVGEPYVVDQTKGQLANAYTTWGAGKWEATVWIPFKVFKINPDGSQTQVSVVFRDWDKNGQWDPDNGVTKYNYMFILDTPYDPTGNDWNPTAGGRDFMAEIFDTGGPVLWTFWFIPRGTMEQFANDFTMDFVAPKVLTPADVYTFTAPSVTYSADSAKTDVAKINVFPNPYYGVNPQELNKYQRFVTFNHLPAKVTIRIFNLAGQAVRVLQKDTPDQFFRWDLNNEAALPVASGVYIAYIDMPDLGTTKIIKIAVVQEQQILDRF